MKKYGYNTSSGMASAPTQNPNADLLLQNLIVETQWEMEQTKTEQEDTVSDAVSDVKDDGAGKTIVDSLFALPPDPGMLVLRSQPVIVEQAHSAYRPPPLDIESETENHTKHMLDKKVGTLGPSQYNKDTTKQDPLPKGYVVKHNGALWIAICGQFPGDPGCGTWHPETVEGAAVNGLILGDNSNVTPDAPIIREQLVAMLWWYAGSPAATKEELDFTDVDEAGNWTLDTLIWAQENGVMQGNNGAVNPKDNATCAHVAQMLKNFIENLIK